MLLEGYTTCTCTHIDYSHKNLELSERFGAHKLTYFSKAPISEHIMPEYRGVWKEGSVWIFARHKEQAEQQLKVLLNFWSRCGWEYAKEKD
jgi:hypothetical protein